MIMMIIIWQSKNHQACGDSEYYGKANAIDQLRLGANIPHIKNADDLGIVYGIGIIGLVQVSISILGSGQIQQQVEQSVEVPVPMTEA